MAEDAYSPYPIYAKAPMRYELDIPGHAFNILEF